jgi:phage baseplate assembly protein gpV
MSSVIRIGTVSKVNYEDGTIEVAYEDRDGSVTDEICVVSNALYRMPVVGAMVCVLHNSDSQEMGTCIGTFWNEDNKPVGGKKQRYRYDYNDKKGKAFEQYDGDSGDYEEKIDGNAKETIGKNLDFTVGGDVTFKVGASTVKVCQSGTIEITGTTVKITGATVNISGGSGDCKINGVSLVNHKHEHDGSAKADPYTVSGNTGVPVK